MKEPIIYNYALKDIICKNAQGDIINVGNIFNIDDYLAYTYYAYAKNTPTISFETWRTQYAGLCDVISSVDVKKLIAFYILPSDYDEIIVQSEKESVEGNEDVKRRVIQLCGWFVKTYPYYKKLIDIYTAEENNLMKPLKTKNKTAYSDMPITATFDTVPTADVMSDLTETENESEIASKMARINEIKQGYDNVYRSWLKEFEKTFILF